MRHNAHFKPSQARKANKVKLHVLYLRVEAVITYLSTYFFLYIFLHTVHGAAVVAVLMVITFICMPTRTVTLA